MVFRLCLVLWFACLLVSPSQVFAYQNEAAEEPTASPSANQPAIVVSFAPVGESAAGIKALVNMSQQPVANALVGGIVSQIDNLLEPGTSWGPLFFGNGESCLCGKMPDVEAVVNVITSLTGQIAEEKEPGYWVCPPSPAFPLLGNLPIHVQSRDGWAIITYQPSLFDNLPSSLDDLFVTKQGAFCSIVVSVDRFPTTFIDRTVADMSRVAPTPYSAPARRESSQKSEELGESFYRWVFAHAKDMSLDLVYLPETKTIEMLIDAPIEQCEVPESFSASRFSLDSFEVIFSLRLNQEVVRFSEVHHAALQWLDHQRFAAIYAAEPAGQGLVRLSTAFGKLIRAEFLTGRADAIFALARLNDRTRLVGAIDLPRESRTSYNEFWQSFATSDDIRETWQVTIEAERVHDFPVHRLDFIDQVFIQRNELALELPVGACIADTLIDPIWVIDAQDRIVVLSGAMEDGELETLFELIDQTGQEPTYGLTIEQDFARINSESGLSDDELNANFPRTLLALEEGLPMRVASDLQLTSRGLQGKITLPTAVVDFMTEWTRRTMQQRAIVVPVPRQPPPIR